MHQSHSHRSARIAVAILFALGCASAVTAADSASQPFNGKDLTGWSFKGGDPAKSKWTAGKAVVDEANAKQLKAEAGGTDLVNVLVGGAHGCDTWTNEKYGDGKIELEVLVPKGSNSGIYVMGEYEIQVLDSFGKDKLGMGDMGAIYSASVPKINASKAPGEWQKYVIDYTAPRFDEAGKKTANGVIKKVVLNDQVIHENVELKGPTPGGVSGKEAPTGPIMFQGDHGPVAFRNIKFTPAAK